MLIGKRTLPVIAYLAMIVALTPAVRAGMILNISDVGGEPTFTFGGPLLYTSDAVSPWWWGSIPVLSAVCIAGNTCDLSAGSLNVAGSLYETPNATSGPFGFNGATIEKFINIYEPDGVTLSDTLQVILTQGLPVRLFFSPPGRTLPVQNASVEMILHSVDEVEELTAFTNSSAAVTFCRSWTGTSSLCSISSLIEDGKMQNITSASAASLGLSLGIQSDVISTVPESSGMFLIGTTLVGLVYAWRKKNR